MPSVLRASAWKEPAEISATPVSAAPPESCTWTGTFEVPFGTLFPSWPESFEPQAQTVPSDFSASEKSRAAATWTTDVNGVPAGPTWTGDP